MKVTRSAISRSFSLAFAICALSGCAQFQDSFGEISDLARPTAYAAGEPASASPSIADEAAGTANAGEPAERSFMYEGVKVEMSDGGLPE